MKAVNLIPAEHRSGGVVGARSQGAAFAVLVVLAGAAILVFMYGSASHQLESSQTEAAVLNKRAQLVKSQAAALTPYTSFDQMREQRLQEISQLINSRFNWSGALGELSRVLPGNVSVATIQGTIGGASATAATPAASSSTPSSSSASPATAATGASSSGGATSATPAGAAPALSLTGCAVNQTAVAETLVRLRLMSGASNVTLQSSTKTTGGGGTASSASGSSSDSCPAAAPSFAVQVSYQPLPTPPTTSTEALESTVSSSSAAGGSHRSDASSKSTGAKR